MDVQNNDDPLTALAAAAQTEPRITADRRRGHEVWGVLALIASVATCGWGAFLLFHPNRIAGWLTPTEAAFLAPAVLFGTVGCRRIAGRKMALASRIIGWSAPTLVRLIMSLRSHAEGDFVIALASAVVWIAIGLFIFALLDALVSP